MKYKYTVLFGILRGGVMLPIDKKRNKSLHNKGVRHEYSDISD